jgi:PRTRC genetic system protein E
MFTKLFEKIINEDSLTLVITKKDNHLSVSVNMTKNKDLSPVTMKGTPEELDENFIKALTPPLDSIRALFKVNTEAFDESVKEAEEKKDKLDKKNAKAQKRAPTKAEAKKPDPVSPMVEMRSLMAESRFKEAKEDLIKLIPKLKGAEKKEAEKLLYDCREELAKINFDADPVEPEPIKPEEEELDPETLDDFDEEEALSNSDDEETLEEEEETEDDPDNF